MKSIITPSCLRVPPSPAYSLPVQPVGMLIDRGRGVILWTPKRSQAGLHPVTVLAQNSAGSDTQEYEIEVYKKPIIADIEDQPTMANELFSYTAVADRQA